MISEIIPHAVYNPEDETYDLHLKVKLENNFAVRLGGNISTSNSNQIYLGLSYQDLNYYAKEFLFDGQLGKVYNNAQFMAKIDFSLRSRPLTALSHLLLLSTILRKTSYFPGMTSQHLIRKTNASLNFRSDYLFF